MQKNVVYLEYSLNVKCPHCKEEIDIADHDDDSIFSRAIFNNKWDDLKDEEFECPKCEKIFLIHSIEY